jgi:hypothetical protein
MPSQLPLLTTRDAFPDAELAPHTSRNAPFADPARVANDPHRALEAAGRHETPSSRTPAEASPHRVGTSANPAGTRAPDHQAPKDLPRTRRPRTRDAIRAAQTLSQRLRFVDVATDGDPMRSLDRDHCRRSVKQQSPARRRKASCDDVSIRRGPVQQAAPLDPARRRETIGSTRTDPLGPAVTPKTAYNSPCRAA